MFGNWGKIMEVDLTSHEGRFQEVSEAVYKKFLGGSGLGTSLLYENVNPRTDAYSPENLLIFATGPFQGTAFPGSAKWMAISKSPLTGTFCVSGAGADFGPKLKRTGVDAITVRGRSKSPVYALVTDKGLEIRDASHLWGKDAIESYEILREELVGYSPSIITIGPAGEKQVAIACLVVDGHSFAGRGGLGAVMGSKNLKALAVSGNQRVDLAHSDRLKTLIRQLNLKLLENTRDTYHKHGTANDVVFCESVGDLPIKYWAGDTWTEGAKKIGAPRFTNYLSAVPNPCVACPIGCHRHITVKRDGETVLQGPGPEYETLGMLGSNCLVEDLDIIAEANDCCNRLGIDTISAGSFVAFSMECCERGLIKPEDVGDVSLQWGDGKTLLELIEQIGTNSGFGAIFGNGIRQAAQQIGGDAPNLAVEVKGMDFPAHDPRTYFSLAINYATSTRGADHTHAFPHAGELGILIPEIGYRKQSEKFSMKGKAELTMMFQNYGVLVDSLVVCNMMSLNGLSVTETLEALNLITGWDFDISRLMEVGERGFNLQRMINIRDGISRADDRLPRRVFEPAKEGPRRGRKPLLFEEALEEYYSMRDWTKEGRPSHNKLQALGL
jgi:aldehyde:ferredoxin oxidoreductase